MVSVDTLSRVTALVFLFITLIAAGPADAQRVEDGVRLQPSPISVSSTAAAIARPIPDIRKMTVSRWAAADEFCETSATGFDRSGLRALYCADAAAVKAPLMFAHRSSYPVFYTAVPAAWLGAWAIRGPEDFTDAYRLTLTQGVTYLTVIGLKRLFQRPRPFMSLPKLLSRSKSYGRDIKDGQYASLPSGHAGLSVALATSWSLSHRHWYVVAPAALWSGAVSLSRLHLGVHYPSDILFGAVLGAGIATGIHLLRDAITPTRLKPEDAGESSLNGIDPAAMMATGPSVVLFTVRF